MPPRSGATSSSDQPLVQSDRKLTGIHGLRGVASLLVVLFHVKHMAGLELPAWLSVVGSHFGLSVHLFFLISAFSLCHAHRFAPSEYLGYLTKRVFRIAPLFYVMLVYHVVRAGYPGWRALASNLSFTFNLFSGQEESLVWAGWSVGVEMLFYLVLPGLLWSVRGLRGHVALLIGTTLLAVCRWWGTTVTLGMASYSAYFSLVGNLPLFAAGLLAYRIYREDTVRALAARRGRGTALALGFVVLLAIAYLDPLRLQPRLTGLYLALWGLPYALLAVWQAWFPSRVLRLSAVQWLADRSFSIYLLHPVVIVLLRPVFAALARVVPAAPGTLYGVCLLVTMPVLLVCAFVTYRWVELPGIRLGHRLAGRVGQRA